jgi:hypothetical protein
MTVMEEPPLLILESEHASIVPNCATTRGRQYAVHWLRSRSRAGRTCAQFAAVIDGRGYSKLQDCRHITAAQNDCRLAAPGVRAATVYLKGRSPWFKPRSIPSSAHEDFGLTPTDEMSETRSVVHCEAVHVLAPRVRQQ